jgi:hypothetical protein
MKRNKNLVDLSRDHHHGLLLGWKIRKGLKKKVALAAIADYIIHFSKEALFPHFEEEENQVLSYLSAENGYYKRTLAEHQAIRQLILRISIKGLTDESLLLRLADELDAHIRFEERELFPHVENLLSIKQLDEMGKMISELHHPYVENYGNDFWSH